MAASLIEKLTISGDGESVGFLNDIVAQLWPNINVAGSRMTKEIAEPMFKTMLPGPLKTLHFTKIDLGPVPMKFSNVTVLKTDHQGIKLDMDLDWDGKCDIELNADMFPKVGIEHVKVHGRLSILLAPLTDIIPLIGAAQVAFINPPTLKIDFTDAANVADFDIIDDTVRKVMLGVISSMAVMPNRFLVKLDANNDFFKTYQYQLGVFRLTVEKAAGFADPTKGKFLTKLMRDAPDCYCKVAFAAEPEWRTATKKNATTPAWNETKDFLVTDYDQRIEVHIMDDDLGGDDHLGIGTTSVKQLLLAGGKEELALTKKKGDPTEIKLALSGQFYEFVADAASLSAGGSDPAQMCGLVTVLVAGAMGIKGAREAINPSVKVTWGDKLVFRTGIKTDAPGSDINNPAFDTAFRIPVTAELAGAAQPFRIVLMDKEAEVGAAEVPFSEVLAAPELVLAKKFDVGNGTTVNASICVRGTKPANVK